MDGEPPPADRALAVLTISNICAGNQATTPSVYEDVTVLMRSDFETMFRSVFPRLVSLGTLKSGRLDVAKELAQETMARAHGRWDELSKYDSPEAWCRTVMTNLLIDHHRSTQSEHRAVERLAARPAQLSSAPNLERWRRLLEPMSKHQQTIVTLYYADDLSVTEISRLLGTTSGSVKASLFKARRSLHKHLQNKEGAARG